MFREEQISLRNSSTEKLFEIGNTLLHLNDYASLLKSLSLISTSIFDSSIFNPPSPSCVHPRPSCIPPAMLPSPCLLAFCPAILHLLNWLNLNYPRSLQPLHFTPLGSAKYLFRGELPQTALRLWLLDLVERANRSKTSLKPWPPHLKARIIFGLLTLTLSKPLFSELNSNFFSLFDWKWSPWLVPQQLAKIKSIRKSWPSSS